MGKCLVFSMDIGQEMFRSFRQIQDRLQIDDLCTRICNGRETTCQQLQITQITKHIFGCYIFRHIVFTVLFRAKINKYRERIHYKSIIYGR